MNVTTVILFLGGGILIYSAYNNEDPRDTIRKAFGKTGKKYPSLDGKATGVAGGALGTTPQDTGIGRAGMTLGPGTGIPVVSV